MYYNFRHTPQADGFAVISSYHKALDVIIEEYIAQLFRSFVNISILPKKVENDSLEKALHSVVHKKYTISAGRLFHLIQTIKEKPHNELHTYLKIFKKFINTIYEIKKVLIDDEEFFELLEEIMKTEVL
jgi:hypothetical protein